ncbi:MAG: hypothetical protein COA58_05170 [Bacteroidetes bacterium]|nr:MAG: hypothetical protein COA58_05170 [Bacteroidota bacterium]
MTKTILYTAVLISWTNIQTRAQTFTPISQNNLSGIYATISNPALAVGGIDKFSFNLVGAGVGIQNNALRSDLDYELVRVVSKRPFTLEPGSLDNIGVEVHRKQVLKPRIYANADALQLAAQVAIGKKLSVFVYSRERGFINFDKGDYHSLKYLAEEKYNHKEPLVKLGFDARSITYQEIGVGLAAEVYNKRKNYLKAGFTYKRLNGRSIFAMNIPEFESKLQNNGIGVTAEMNIIKTTLDFAAQNPLDFILRPDIGQGTAIDLGFVYEHRPYNLKHTYRKNNPKKKNKVFNRRNLVKYDYRFGVSLLDAGKITYNKKAVTVNEYRLNTHFSPEDLAEMTGDDYAQSILDSATLTSNNRDVIVELPTTVVLQYDQRLLKGWFLGVNYTQNIRKNKLASIYVPSNLQVQIRKETEHCVFGFPTLIVPSTRTYTLGAYAQTGPFFIGTQNIGTLFLKKIYNPSFYAGLVCNIRYKKDSNIENHKSFKTRRTPSYWKY